jgi:cytochrome c oxidase subunit II
VEHLLQPAGKRVHAAADPSMRLPTHAFVPDRPPAPPFGPGRASVWIVVGAALFAAACDGPQSTLTPAGTDAADIANVFAWMSGGAVLIWVVVIGLAVYALGWPRQHSDRAARLLILGGGVAFPTIVLTVLLSYGLALMPRVLELGPPGAMRIAVYGEQWWWRVHYVRPDGTTVTSANEMRLPRGARTNLELHSADVIHSFWIPSLAGKMDMIPGRITRLAVEPTRTGTFRGQCAEYCGASHALMAFDAIVMEPDAFETWLDSQAAAATAPATALAQTGRQVFDRTGCGACHTVRGTDADGMIGPDLTHVGARRTIGAGTLPNNRGTFFRWVMDVDRVKPGAHMPAFRMLPSEDLRALAAYLESLQ